jgi:hypothetical protein
VASTLDCYARPVEPEPDRQGRTAPRQQGPQGTRRLTQPGREDIRRYFDGVCLSVNAFAAEVCSPEFTDKARQRRKEQHEPIVQAFTPTPA